MNRKKLWERTVELCSTRRPGGGKVKHAFKRRRHGQGAPLWWCTGSSIALWSCPEFGENSMDRGAWWAAVHVIAKSWTQLSDFTFTFHFHALEKKMATHSSVLAWRIPGTGEPGGVSQSRTQLKRLSSSSSSSSSPVDGLGQVIDSLCVCFLSFKMGVAIYRLS